jgi:tryprostatin B 6-hydroxylase
VLLLSSDTTATTLSNIIYELGRNVEHIDILRAEVAPYMTDPTGEVVHERIAHLDHLNGIIYEALRLHPPVPTALQRKTPPEGIEVDGTYIPGNTTVYCPQYVIGRSEKIYPRPGQFLPERWYKYPEMVKEKSAFAPFSAGKYIISFFSFISCVFHGLTGV